MPTRSLVPVAVVVLVCSALAWSVVAAVPAAATECTQDWQPAAVPAYLQPDGSPTAPAVTLPPPPSSAHEAFHVRCDGRYVNTVWLGPRISPTEEHRVAIELVARAVYPSVRPAVNPARGITGLASWFWADRDPAPVRMRPGNGPGLEFELRAETVRWRFGDGTGSVTGLGVPFPAPSPVTHVFERKGTFTVEAQVVVAGRVWGQELIVDLNGSHTTTLRHDVAEVRSLLHAR